MKITYLILFVTTVFCSCKPSGSSESTTNAEGNATEAAVMALHDEVMPKVNEITDLSAKLRQYKAGLPESANERIEMPDSLNQVMESLKLSEQGMWEWMKAYSDTKATLTADQVEPFMQKQLDILNKVNSDMTHSIERAKSWIATHPAK